MRAAVALGSEIILAGALRATVGEAIATIFQRVGVSRAGQVARTAAIAGRRHVA
jgi:hypothetical protein